MQEIRVSHPSTNQKMLLDFTKISNMLHTLPINSYVENSIFNSYDLSSANPTGYSEFSSAIKMAIKLQRK